MKTLMTVTLLFTLFACSTSANHSDSEKADAMNSKNDPYLWLEDVTAKKSMDWVRLHNQKSMQELSTQKIYPELVKEVRKIVTSKDRIPYVALVNDKYKNFWQDEHHLRGIVRETTPESYRTAHPKWETILDIDALNKKENKSWVYHGMPLLPPDNKLALVKLSDGGSDREVVREFDMTTRHFIPNGFILPEGKHVVSWIDQDTLLIGTDFGPGTLTDSGYPRQVRIWKRGTPLASAKLIFEGKTEDVSVSGYKSFRPESSFIFIERGLSFFESEVHLYDPNTAKLTKIPFPTTASFGGAFDGYLLASLRKDWKTSKGVFNAGSLVSLPVDKIGASDFEDYLELVYEPDARSTLNGMDTTKSFLLLSTLSNVHGQILMVHHTDSGWKLDPMDIPEGGDASVSGSDPYSDKVLVSFQNFTTPPSLYSVNLEKPPLNRQGDLRKPHLVKTLPAQYNTKDVVTEQKEAISKDGTKIPYFLIHKKGMKLDGTNLTLQYGYGGFEIALTPYYLGTLGKVWIERGGVYAYTNIRGGGEFGPKWHEAALKEHRQRAFDDFIAISEDLIRSKITTPKHLGIRGGSNGGLLVGAVFVQRPELYNAVLCESALLDMLRYQKLPPGASWIGEYGNPDIPEQAAYIAKYSPYQNVKEGVKYPKVFFYTSTGDDRVQPGHTRKMVARMESFGDDVLLYENTEGGHGAAADLEQTIQKSAMEYTYLLKQLQ
jgi:prolyl oligopeptidase